MIAFNINDEILFVQVLFIHLPQENLFIVHIYELYIITTKLFKYGLNMY